MQSPGGDKTPTTPACGVSAGNGLRMNSFFNLLAVLFVLTVFLAVFEIPDEVFSIPRKFNLFSIEKEDSELIFDGIPAPLNRVPSCVPYFEPMNNEHLRNYERRNQTHNLTTPIILNAFQYENHVTVLHQTPGWIGLPVYCRYFTEQRIELFPAEPGFTFPDFTVNCCRRPGAKYVGLEEHGDAGVRRILPFEDRTSGILYNLSLCLLSVENCSESFWNHIQEFVEHHKLHGVQNFYIYLKYIDEESIKQAKRYEESGDVEIIKLTEEMDGEQGQIFSITDCLVRSRLHSKFVAFADPAPLSDLSDHRDSCKLDNGAIHLKNSNILAQYRVVFLANNSSHFPELSEITGCVVDPTRVMIISTNSTAL